MFFETILFFLPANSVSKIFPMNPMISTPEMIDIPSHRLIWLPMEDNKSDVWRKKNPFQLVNILIVVPKFGWNLHIFCHPPPPPLDIHVKEFGYNEHWLLLAYNKRFLLHNSRDGEYST